MQTLERGLHCLFTLAASDRPLSVVDIARLVNLPKANVYRLLGPLQESGLVERVDGKRVLGLRVLEFYRSVGVHHKAFQIGDIAKPIMQELAEATRETVILSAVAGQDAVCIESIDSTQAVRLSFEKGRINPIYAGASAKVLLAHMAGDFQEQGIARAHGLRYANGAPIDCGVLREQLRQGRRDGFIVTTGEVDLGATAIAAPILGKDRDLVAGLSVAGPALRFGEPQLSRTTAMVLSAAQRISARYVLGSDLSG